MSADAVDRPLVAIDNLLVDAVDELRFEAIEIEYGPEVRVAAERPSEIASEGARQFLDASNRQMDVIEIQRLGAIEHMQD